MTTGDTSRSPSLGGEQREGPTGREPGLPRLHQQRYEEMSFFELLSTLTPTQKLKFDLAGSAYLKSLPDESFFEDEAVNTYIKIVNWRKRTIIKILTART